MDWLSEMEGGMKLNERNDEQYMDLRLEKKLKAGSIPRTNVQWAWEFLRRNNTYKALFGYWKSGLQDSHSPYSAAEREQIEGWLEGTGIWRRRFEPWVRAGFESGLRFLKWEFDEEERRTTFADRRLDPMNFMLEKWLDPTLSPLPANCNPFDIAAALEVSAVRMDSWEGISLWLLGIIEGGALLDRAQPPQIASHKTWTVAREGSVDQFDLTLNLQFDLSLPLQPQIKQALNLLERQRKAIQTAIGKQAVPAFFEPRIVDKLGTYTECVAMLDAFDELDSVAEAARRVSGDPTLKARDPIYKRLEKARTLGEKLRSSAYRALAFTPDSRLTRKALRSGK